MQPASNIHKHSKLAFSWRLRIARPRIQLIAPLPAEKIIMALPAKNPIEISGRTLHRLVAPQAIVASKAKDRVEANAAINAIAPGGAGQRVISGTAIYDPYPIAAAR